MNYYQSIMVTVDVLKLNDVIRISLSNIDDSNHDSYGFGHDDGSNNSFLKSNISDSLVTTELLRIDGDDDNNESTHRNIKMKGQSARKEEVDVSTHDTPAASMNTGREPSSYPTHQHQHQPTGEVFISIQSLGSGRVIHIVNSRQQLENLMLNEIVEEKGEEEEEEVRFIRSEKDLIYRRNDAKGGSYHGRDGSISGSWKDGETSYDGSLDTDGPNYPAGSLDSCCEAKWCGRRLFVSYKPILMLIEVPNSISSTDMHMFMSNKYSWVKFYLFSNLIIFICWHFYFFFKAIEIFMRNPKKRGRKSRLSNEWKHVSISQHTV